MIDDYGLIHKDQTPTLIYSNARFKILIIQGNISWVQTWNIETNHKR